MKQREKHPLAGTPVELTDGPFKGRYFTVIDWLQNMYHGKSMENIHKVHPDQTREVVKRKGLDDKIVWGKLYPAQNFVSVHDDDMKKLSKSEERRLTVISGGKDDSRGTDQGDSEDSGTGGPESEGRSVSADAPTDEGHAGDSTSTETEGPAGSGSERPKKNRKRTTTKSSE